MNNEDNGKKKTSHLSANQILSGLSLVIGVGGLIGSIMLLASIPERHEAKPAGETAATFNIQSLAQRVADEKAKQEKELREGSAWVEGVCNDVREKLIAPLAERGITGFTAEIEGHYAGKGLEACIIRKHNGVKDVIVTYLEHFNRSSSKEEMNAKLENAIIKALNPDEVAQLAASAKSAPSLAP